ncbi:MAG TPA: IS21 family transposase [Candidatus Methylomirabilis sp.]|nr:IS21 family transposase [Candidatus Methylomirabilis sp.]
MGARRLPMRQIREILRLKYERGMRNRAIARACGVGVGTVSEYLTRARQAGVSWPLPGELDDTALEARMFPRPAPGQERAAPDLVWVHQELKKTGVTLYLLWEEYRQVHPQGYGYSQFCELYRRFHRKLKPSMRQEHRAGEKIFIDFSGKKPHIVDPKTGEEIAVELFVACLGASCYTYAESTLTQKLADWTGAHIRMLEYFSGTSEIWVPDQLKSAISQSCRYEATVNRSYRELARHYGAVVIPARPYKARDKAKVESMVLVAQRWILARLRNCTLFSLDELNAAIAKLLEDLNARPMQKVRVSRRELFERLDQPVLKPLPVARYELGEWKTCNVNIDYHVEVDHHFYSVPYQLIDEEMEARYTATTVEIFHKDKRLESYPRRYDHQPTTKAEHMPSSHRAHAEWTPSRLIHWAEKTGPATGRLVEGILKRWPHPEQGYRACLGVMRLGRTYGPERLESASARAEHLRSYTYRTVKNILAAAQDRLPLEAEPAVVPVTPVHENIRGASHYAAAGEETEC